MDGGKHWIDMKSTLQTGLITLILVLLVQAGYAAPKVTQAASCSFKDDEPTVHVLAVEEFGKPLRLLFVGNAKDVVYSTFFTETLDEFSFLQPFLRFRRYTIPGFPSALIIATSVSYAPSDTWHGIKLIAKINGTITTINPEEILLGSQEGLYLGYINAKFGSGMIIWQNKWEDESHYEPHRYDISIYGWDNESMRFRLSQYLTTEDKFADGCSALKSYGLPYRNYKDEIVPIEEEISTLGIEDALLPDQEMYKHPITR